LTASLTQDTKDSFLTATRGYFMSHALQFSPEALGSDVRFLKYFGQYFTYVPLNRRSALPFGKGREASRLVYAGAMRIGLASGLGGQDLVPSERFFAGGGTTLRGFKQNEVGPKDARGDPAGGNAEFLFNNELRFPIYRIFDGVGFLDVGNVYPRLSDFNPLKVRKSAGFGLRVYTPYFMLRFDYGFKLGRSPGESSGRFFFSIGQAF
jgi:outer membrane protein assembly factor BamA